MLTPGTRLGPYEIAASLGAGGMGEVYRARDTRLDRPVAIKVLPEALGLDAEFRARFEREARAISQLHHPNICALYDVGRHEATDYLVLEYLEGETLASRLERTGALDRETALTLAVQIASALDAAHRAGIVHRDLKPGNVMLTRASAGSAPLTAKLLDFGLAKPASPPTAASPLTEPPTRTTPITVQGAILGTFQYMAPEHLEGKDADARSDIWAFGCVLYECLTGRRPFEGASQASLIGAILKDQPAPVSRSAPQVPAALDRVVATCLAKDPDDRWQSASDLCRELQWIRDAAAFGETRPERPARRLGTPLVWIGATLVVAALTGLGVWRVVRPAPVPGRVFRAVLPLTVDTLTDDPAIAIAPNGQLVAYVTPDGSALMLRDLPSGESRVLVSGRRVDEPFFSPDSRQVGFVVGATSTFRTGVWGEMERVAVGGGAPVKVLDGVASLKGASWGDDGWIYYTPAPAVGLWRVRADGGTPERLTTPDASAGEKTHRRPFVLPGSNAVLFVVGTSRITSFDDARIEALSMADRTRHRLVEGGTAPQYLAALGDLVYVRNGSLVVQPFDATRLQLRGTPTTVAKGVSEETVNGVGRYSVSTDGTLLSIPEGTTPQAEILSVDRQDRATPLAQAPLWTPNGALSPDGTRLAIDPDGATQQIAILDLTRNSTQRFTYEWDNADPVWTPDGRRLVFLSDVGGGKRNIYWQAADGSGAPERLTTSTQDQLPDTVAGRQLVYESYDPKTLVDLWTLSLDDRVPHVLLQTPFNETAARFSPDGRWLAYQSDQAEPPEVYLQPMPSTGRRWQVSVGGGTRPIWLPGGRELAYLKGRDVMTATLTLGPTVAIGVPVKLFTLTPDDTLLDVTRAGRFLVVRQDHAVPQSPDIVVNWFAEVRRLTAGAAQ
jgi:eukaryotic-like serine/threonine-protein kinase